MAEGKFQYRRIYDDLWAVYTTILSGALEYVGSVQKQNGKWAAFTRMGQLGVAKTRHAAANMLL